MLRLQTTEHDAFVSDRTRTTPPELAPPETGQSRSATALTGHIRTTSSRPTVNSRGCLVSTVSGSTVPLATDHRRVLPQFPPLRATTIYETIHNTTPRFTYENGTMASSQPSLNGSRPSNPQTTPTCWTRADAFKQAGMVEGRIALSRSRIRETDSEAIRRIRRANASKSLFLWVRRRTRTETRAELYPGRIARRANNLKVSYNTTTIGARPRDARNGHAYGSTVPGRKGSSWRRGRCGTGER
uniref:Uncharacterized protein n=1 Tax=Mycena chlorophos TaxID=658473 RepID=A0ABQ0KUB1_MYCCL|nr:predicted protein [Mycena chlorophos]